MEGFYTENEDPHASEYIDLISEGGTMKRIAEWIRKEEASTDSELEHYGIPGLDMKPSFVR